MPEVDSLRKRRLAQIKQGFQQKAADDELPFTDLLRRIA